MKKYFHCVFAALLVTGSALVLAGDKGDGPAYYTQHTFYYEKGHYITTNYARGGVVPINTLVQITDTGRKSIELKLKDGTPVEVENVEKYSKQDIKGIQARLLGEKPASLEGFSADIQQAIKNGVLKVGMRKSAVLLARGYPPAHVTPTLEADKWIYWQNRFNRIELTFDKDKLVQIKE